MSEEREKDDKIDSFDHRMHSACCSPLILHQQLRQLLSEGHKIRSLRLNNGVESSSVAFRVMDNEKKLE